MRNRPSQQSKQKSSLATPKIEENAINNMLFGSFTYHNVSIRKFIVNPPIGFHECACLQRPTGRLVAHQRYPSPPA
jgi:hypothetical protein